MTVGWFLYQANAFLPFLELKVISPRESVQYRSLLFTRIGDSP
jgi:hypothetical protein